MPENVKSADVETVIETITDSERRARDIPGRNPDAEQRYDFSHPDLLSREQTRSLRTLHEGYAQALAKRLSTELLSNVAATVAAVDHLTYGEFLLLAPTPTVLAVVEVEELEGKIALDLQPGLAFAFVDRLLGGPGERLEATRTLTTIEQGLMDRVLRRACQEMEAIWRPFQELHLRLLSIESNPEMARIVSQEEMVVLVSLELVMNEVTGTLNLCLPYVVMEPAFHRLGQGTGYSGGSTHDTRAVREALDDTVRSCPVSVQVEMGTATLSLGELLDLEPGDVLRIVPASGDGARAALQGFARLNGVPGRHRGRRAFRVTEVHPPSPGKKGKRE